MCLQLCAANDKSFIFISKIAIPSNRFHRGRKTCKIGGKLAILKAAQVRRIPLQQLTVKFFCLIYFLVFYLEIYLMAPTKIHVAAVMTSIKGMKNG